MKNLTDILFNESRGWQSAGKAFGGQDFKWDEDKEFFWMNTEGEQYGFLFEDQIRSFAEDFDDEDAVEDIIDLKPGEMYDADGGINIYIRIK